MIAVASAAGNLLIELVLVFEFDMGIAGAAWSTVIAQWGAAVAFAVAVHRHVRAVGARLRLVAAAAWRYARVGAQMFVRTASLRGAFVLAAVFAARIGTTEVASHEIGVQIWSFFSLALDAVAIAGQAMVAKELGASRPDVARAASVRMIGMSIQLSAVFGLALVLLRGPIASIFSNDPAVVALSGFILLFVAVAQPVNAAAFAFDGIFIGAGDLGFLARAMAGAAVGFAIVGGAVRILDLGIGWLWTAAHAVHVLPSSAAVDPLPGRRLAAHRRGLSALAYFQSRTVNRCSSSIRSGSEPLCDAMAGMTLLRIPIPRAST